MTAVKEFNGLNGRVVSRKKLQEIATLANSQGQIHVVDRLNGVLSINKDAESFKVNISQPANDLIPEQDLPGLCGVPSYFNDEEIGLGKGVSPDEIYSYITELIIETIKVSGHLPWQMTWDKEMTIWDGIQAVNYQSKKPYRGINYWFTNFEVKINSNGQRELAPRDLTNPYFLTFNQIESNGGKLKKGAKGVRVFYFTKLYSHTEMLSSGKKLSIGTYNQKWFFQWLTKHKNQIKDLASGRYTVAQMASNYLPILKYYNIFHGKDVTGIKWPKYEENKNADLPKKQRIEVADNIVNAMPKKPEILFKGNQPAYYPSFDHIRMPRIETFNSEQEYYATLFHELVHSTGHRSRIRRWGVTGGNDKTKRDYAFEELIAEMGAVFLCAESGILFSVINNSASYLKGWNNALVEKMGDDNRFFFRASSKSQAAADFILDRDSEGVPAYRQLKIQKPKSPAKNKIPKLEKITTTKKPSTRKPSKKPSTPKVNANGQYALLGPAVIEPQIVPTTAAKPETKNVYSASDIMGMKFETLQLDKEWAMLFPDAPKVMHLAIWGGPKNGKSVSACQWAENRAKTSRVLYNFADQGINASTKKILQLTGLHKSKNVFFSTTNTLDQLEADIKDLQPEYVFIDMINNYIDNQGVKPNEFKERFIKGYPGISFILVFEVTKGGVFKGDQAWTHIVDQLVTVSDYIMTSKGRYGTGERIVWDEGAQRFNPKKYNEIMESFSPIKNGDSNESREGSWLEVQ
jgi:antirestriction protein ArdC